MKKLLIIILLAGTWKALAADAGVSSPPKYTTNTFLKLYQAKKENLVDQDAFESLVQKRGIDFEFDAALIWSLKENNPNFTLKDIQELEKVCKMVAANKPGTPNPANLPPFIAISTNHVSLPAGVRDSILANLSPEAYAAMPPDSLIGPVMGNINSSMLVSNSMPAAKVEALTTNFAPVFSKYLDLQAGVVVLSPFSILSSATTPRQFELKPNNGADVRGMIQATYKYRYAWRNDYQTADATPTTDEGSKNFWLFGDPTTFDFEFHGGYAYSGSGSQSATTIGAGDLYEEASIGLNILKMWDGHEAKHKPIVTVLNLEGFESIATDRDYSLIHPAGGVGLAYVAGIPMETITNSPKLEIFARTGIALVDSPVLTGVDAANGYAIVAGNPNGNPEFSMKAAWATSAELRLPIGMANGQYGYLCFGGTIYKLLDGGNRDQWSMYAAYSISLPGLLNAIQAPAKLLFGTSSP